MTGDRHKPLKTFIRWINNFDDGVENTTKKGHNRIPSLSEKRKEKRWRRHKARRDMQKSISQFYDDEIIETSITVDRIFNEKIGNTYHKLSVMPPEEFSKELEKHKNGDIAKILLYSKAVLLKPSPGACV